MSGIIEKKNMGLGKIKTAKDGLLDIKAIRL